MAGLFTDMGWKLVVGQGEDNYRDVTSEQSQVREGMRLPRERLLPGVCVFLEPALWNLPVFSLSLPTTCFPTILPPCGLAASNLTKVPVIVPRPSEIIICIDWPVANSVEKEIQIYLKGRFYEEESAGRIVQLENEGTKWARSQGQGDTCTSIEITRNLTWLWKRFA